MYNVCTNLRKFRAESSQYFLQSRVEWLCYVHSTFLYFHFMFGILHLWDLNAGRLPTPAKWILFTQEAWDGVYLCVCVASWQLDCVGVGTGAFGDMPSTCSLVTVRERVIPLSWLHSLQHNNTDCEYIRAANIDRLHWQMSMWDGARICWSDTLQLVCYIYIQHLHTNIINYCMFCSSSKRMF